MLRSSAFACRLEGGQLCSANSVLHGVIICSALLLLRQIVYVGDGNNIVHSWIRLAAAFDFHFVCACPKGYEPDPATVALANEGGAGRVSISHDASEVQQTFHTSCSHCRHACVKG